MLNRGSEQPQSNPFQERRHVFMSLDIFRKNIKESLKNSRNGCFFGCLFSRLFLRRNHLHRLIGKYSQVRCWVEGTGCLESGASSSCLGSQPSQAQWHDVQTDGFQAISKTYSNEFVKALRGSPTDDYSN